ncbi:MAG: FadR family transcriptional regulator [Proteobacteria bacterium]|nr:FadR family transcriptional regulator [Pseudomonadota bacterium]
MNEDNKRLPMVNLDHMDPIARPSVPEQVAGKLLELVRTGNLKPGDRLPPERKLAQVLRVSRPSLREALRALQILGVLRVQHGGGIYVSALEPGDFLAPLAKLMALDARNADTLHEARSVIEGEVAALAAARITDEELERLRAIMVLQKRLADDPISFRMSDAEFHQIIIGACRNPFLGQMAMSYYSYGMEYRRIASETPGVISRSLIDHEGIIKALASRNAERARTAMIQHTSSIHQTTKVAMGTLQPQDESLAQPNLAPAPPRKSKVSRARK